VSRWTYPTFDVVVGSNKQQVRCLTARERREFSGLGAKVRDKEIFAAQIPEFVVQWGAINPTLSMEEVQDMPTDLIDACREKIMELTGFRDDDEKKEPTPDSPPPSTPAAE
jgi:hypothetical protein